MKRKWESNSWVNYPVLQQPHWPDINKYNEIITTISRLPALVFAGETRCLIDDLAEAGRGNAFVLQAGDCSEDFDSCHGPLIHSMLKAILQMALTISYGLQTRVIKIGRIAGQYAKPRTSDFENVNGLRLPSYRGDMVNAIEATLKARTPNPSRIMEGYFRSTATLNLIRAFVSGGYASLRMAYHWSEEQLGEFSKTQQYKQLTDEICRCLDFLDAIGISKSNPIVTETSFYTSHEALILGYEQALTRVDSTTGQWFDTSAHMLWVGDRTRRVDGAHIEFLRGIGNPVGIKVGPQFDLEEILKIIKTLNPQNTLGKVVIITRFGSEKVGQLLPQLIKSVQKARYNVVWLCDPMHGNTKITTLGKKTRGYEDIVKEINLYFEIHRKNGTIPAGVHLEMTGQSVTECVSLRHNLTEANIEKNYTTLCDPRLNARQALDLGFDIVEISKQCR